jgi:hypothetical protein
MSITLAQLKSQSRDRADMGNSQFVTDSELTNYINSSIAELHDLLISAYDNDYYVTEYTFNTVAGTSKYNLPADFYKIRGIDSLISGTQWENLQPFNFNERNSKLEFDYNSNNIRYRLVGSQIMFNPAPTGVYSMKLWYIPVAVKLSSDSDTLADLNQFAEYVIVDAAIKMSAKEESDVTVLMAQKAELRRRIEVMGQNRNADKSDSVSDIYAENIDYLWYIG